jgi:glycosyltransferase involved in cell wall biosynthesis
VPLFTVFTATYNRAHTLPRVYESLRAQTCRDFEWLIVDDGSKDSTGELVERWQREADFPIRYIWQENRGKHVAHNHGVREARGELFLGLDSDDGCVPHALERLKHHWEQIPAAERGRFTGVCVSCVDEKGNAVGSRFPGEWIDSDSLEIRYRYKVEGEKWGFQRTDVLREFPFPEPPGVRFVNEIAIYRPIARRYKIRYVNEPLRIYYSFDAAQSERLVNSVVRHAEGMRLPLRGTLQHDLKWFRFAPLGFLRDAARYVRFSFDSGVGALKQAAELRSAAALALWVVALPVGYLYHLKDYAASTRRDA